MMGKKQAYGEVRIRLKTSVELKKLDIIFLIEL